MKSKVETSLNEQIHAEIYSFYLYLAVSAWFKNRHLDGFGHWMSLQAQEEMGHAMKLFDYLIERGGKVNLLPIDAPPHSWDSPTEAVHAVLKHEQFITGRINNLVNTSVSEGDHATTVMLHWYVNEQVEEEANADTLYNQVKMLEGSNQGLLMLDREVAGRQLSPAE